MSVSAAPVGGYEGSFEGLGASRIAPANDWELRPEERVAGLYREHRTAILARCRRVLRDDAAAEDALQETFMRVVRHARKAPAGREALAWMYRIATNYCL